MSQRALGQQFAALGLTTGEFKPHVSEGGAHKHFTPATGNEIWDEGSYFAGNPRKEGPDSMWGWLDGAVQNEYQKRGGKPFGRNPSN